MREDAGLRSDLAEAGALLARMLRRPVFVGAAGATVVAAAVIAILGLHAIVG